MPSFSKKLSAPLYWKHNSVFISLFPCAAMPPIQFHRTHYNTYHIWRRTCDVCHWLCQYDGSMMTVVLRKQHPVVVWLLLMLRLAKRRLNNVISTVVQSYTYYCPWRWMPDAMFSATNDCVRSIWQNNHSDVGLNWMRWKQKIEKEKWKWVSGDSNPNIIMMTDQSKWFLVVRVDWMDGNIYVGMRLIFFLFHWTEMLNS